MRIPLDHGSAVPLYQQIESYLRQNILSGNLLPETRLPATRQLAQDLGVSRITVRNAYAELESGGLIDSREGSGTYVLPLAPLPAFQKSAAGIIWPLWQQEVEAGIGEELVLAQVLRPQRHVTLIQLRPVQLVMQV